MILRTRAAFAFADDQRITHRKDVPVYRLKIALVTETFPPEINGVAMTLSHLVEGLAQRGHWLTVSRPRQIRELAEPSSSLYAENLFPSLPIPGYGFLRFGLPARRALRNRWMLDRPDLVHVATEGPLGYSALLAARSLRIPTTSSFHTNFHRYGQHYGFPFLTRVSLAYLRHFHNRTLATFSPTDELNLELARDGFRNLRLLSRGVNNAVFSPVHRSESLRASYLADPTDFLVVHVSRLAPEKNYPLLFKSFAAIKKKLPRARLVVVSDGPLRKKLTRAHPDVFFPGFLPRQALAAHYASADIFLYPSLTETFGNVVTEAMSSGLPVVAFNYAAAGRYISSNENGVVVPLEDESSFVDAAVALASDRAKRLRLGAAARQTAETISWERVIDGLENDLSALASPTTHLPHAETMAS